jgi:hypothetical protein
MSPHNRYWIINLGLPLWYLLTLLNHSCSINYRAIYRCIFNRSMHDLLFVSYEICLQTHKILIDGLISELICIAGRNRLKESHSNVSKHKKSLSIPYEWNHWQKNERVWIHLSESCVSIFSFMCIFCRSLFVHLSVFFWPLCCLSFFDLRVLITPLVSSNSS